MTRTRRVNLVSAGGLVGGAGTEHAPESTSFDTATASFLRYCRIRNLADETLNYYRDTSRQLIRLLPEDIRPIDVTRGHMLSAIEQKQMQTTRSNTKLSDETMNRYLRGWRAFFNYLADEGFIRETPFSGIKLIKSERRLIETFSKDQLNRLLAVPNRQTFTGYRDYVLMLLLVDTGVRIREVEGLKVSDIDWNERIFKVYGKGRKERLVPFSKTLDRHLREYLALRGVLDHDFVFVNIDNGPFKIRGMQQTIKSYGIAANLKGVRCSPHTFRHTFAKMYIMNGGDSFSLQKILGHTSLEIVKIYVSMFGTDVARQHAKYSPLDRLLD